MPFPLLEFPNELLYKIFREHFDDDQVPELFTISLTCRRLHDICLTHYLSRFGISHPTETCRFTLRNFTESRPDAISGLRVALFVQSIHHLFCTFDDALLESEAPSPAAIITTVRRLQSLLLKLKSVNKITLRFRGRDWNNGSVNVTDTLLTLWSSAIGDLLNLALEKSCTSLCMIDGKVMNYAYQFSRAGRGYPSNVLTTRRTAVRGPDWTFRRVKQGTSTILVDEATIPNGLHTLDIQSSMLLLPPLSNWALSVLTVITSLTISHIRLAGHMWTALLPTVAQYASGIQELRVAGCPDIVIDDLVAFLALLPELKTLVLSDEEQYIPGPSAPVPKLTELECIQAPWRILLHIVQGSLPSLKEVRTFPRCTPRRGLDWEGTGAVLRVMRECFREQEIRPVVIIRVRVDKGWLSRVETRPSNGVRLTLRLVKVVEMELLEVKVGVGVLAAWLGSAFDAVREIRIFGMVQTCCGNTEDIEEAVRKEVKLVGRIVVEEQADH
ncbi:uncharacterized protein BT62DRAFT_926657 [Guyanagaster necrorhizus]|uniref:F-box domain-containing protein n=1 Tax=Guyanagaster necrorhizus TaxID=856835 RepID=A0A9P7W1R9_9AGAR|nr:uncharacterized protein BT62DRAFT_926657 [Guyanagaster necrorhizus MCA 3950]KAG7450999.1 hypothetical protein BT62DRAFT_926657 [Guyanagaster necrorhizus MCA 3950]